MEYAKNELKPGIKNVMEFEVKKEHLADFLSSGDVAVLSTPSLILFMEHTSRLSVEDLLKKEYTTVGTKVDVKHLAPAPLGAVIRVESELISIEGRKLTFNVRAYWKDKLIGEGTHERYIVNKEHFLKKIQEELNK
ncbi:MAG: thioesterase family protein [Euryarchaeota archaeon]|nr:thioesterase family protein [Euryarchaeota archaeon]